MSVVTPASTPEPGSGVSALPDLGSLPIGGAAEVARLLGTTKPHVTMLYTRQTRGFPAPGKYLDATPLWWLPDVEEWIRRTGWNDRQRGPRHDHPGM